MRVAVIGAGLSGLACAKELKKYGITPVVFDKKGGMGEILDFSTISLNMFRLSYRDILKLAEKKFDLKVSPQYVLNKLTMICPGRTMTAKGEMGYIFKRGVSGDSLENQIAAQAGVQVTYDTLVSVKDIENEFDYVVAATGTDSAAKELGILSANFNSLIRVATVLGEFETGSVRIWLNTHYAKNGFAYLVPTSSTDARLVLVVQNITNNELDHFWKMFLSREDIGYPIIETRDLEHNVGFVDPVNTGKVYLVGNAGGFMDDIFGFGAGMAVVSGVSAGRAIALGKDYNEMMQPFIKDVRKKHEIRKTLNTFGNEDFNKLLCFLGLPVINQLVYNNPLFKAAHCSHIAKLYNRIKGIRS